MAEYGITPQGPNIKRLDVILDEMHDQLSEAWGVNTRQNPESFLNVLLTVFADKLAELWELGEDVYHSQYPATAEGISLDNAVQYGGVTREAAAKSYYPIHCTGIDGTVLEEGTLLASNTNPATQLILSEERKISRDAFNSVQIKVAAAESGGIYTAAVNGTVYSITAASGDAAGILRQLAAAIREPGFSASIQEEDELLTLAAEDVASTNALILSENLTTETVTSIITFGTVETGDILLPEGVVNWIVRADSGLRSVANLCPYIAGRGEESDASLRKSYAEKIFNRSVNMLESIRSSILNNVQGVSSVAVYENPSHETDAYGRPPHSVEIVVDGGDSQAIAQQILDNKAGGINTYGDISVILPGKYDEDIAIRFNRPVNVYTWFYLGVTLNPAEAIPPNYAELLRACVLENMKNTVAGRDVVPQQFVSKMHEACSGISYIDVKLFATTEYGVRPAAYPDRSVTVSVRERAITTEEMIEVTIHG